MATPLTADEVLAVLREAGLKVREYPGWRTNNRNRMGLWGPVQGVMIHHTASGDGPGIVDVCYRGRSDLPGPLCLGVIAKDGMVHLVGNGRANHAGPQDDTGLDGNARYYGFECVNWGDGKDPWPEAQLDAIARASAALCRAHRWSASAVIGHKEWAPSRKIDPRGFEMNALRGRIAARLHEEEEMTPEQMDVLADMVAERLLDRLPAAVWGYRVRKLEGPETWSAGAQLGALDTVLRRVERQIASAPEE